MKKILTSPILSALFRLLLGSVFIYAGVFKVADPWAFSDAIYNYRILPDLLIDIFTLWIIKDMNRPDNIIIIFKGLAHAHKDYITDSARVHLDDIDLVNDFCGR